MAGVVVAGAADVVSATGDAEVSEVAVEPSLEHAERPRTATAMVAAVSVLR
jgi:hypothetical protein